MLLAYVRGSHFIVLNGKLFSSTPRSDCHLLSSISRNRFFDTISAGEPEASSRHLKSRTVTVCLPDYRNKEGAARGSLRYRGPHRRTLNSAAGEGDTGSNSRLARAHFGVNGKRPTPNVSGDRRARRFASRAFARPASASPHPEAAFQSRPALHWWPRLTPAGDPFS
jgi:hypothetical protein